MAIKTPLQKVEEVQAAITAILVTGQAYDSYGRSLTRGDLATLRALEKDYLAEYKATQGTGGPVFNVGIPRRTY
jgi:hypothetical protein